MNKEYGRINLISLIIISIVILLVIFGGCVLLKKRVVIEQAVISELNGEAKSKYINIINGIEKEYAGDELRYELIYFNKDNVLDLMISDLGNWVCVYVYDNGEVVNPIAFWPYDYTYLEKKGIVLSKTSEFNGGIKMTGIHILNSENEFDTLQANLKGKYTEENRDDVDKAFEEYGGYYYKREEITEKKYKEILKENDINLEKSPFQKLEATKSAGEVKLQLTK